MDLQGALAHCSAKPGAHAGHPFGPGALVLKVGGKIFAILYEGESTATISLKVEPEIVLALRNSFAAVTPGYHLNKRHWNTVALDGSIPSHTIAEWIDDSYDLIVEGLPRRVRDDIVS